MVDHIWISAEIEYLIETDQCEVCDLIRWEATTRRTYWYRMPNQWEPIESPPDCTPSLLHLAQAYKEKSDG